ncbi:hypothetical protein MGU_10285 [Metarhizium guizhouense ARSEF 977]|uniref:Uncharacterized protein n=1 Tax=Metarhizium guizhouense (strain ARSEF 977) TaxID=1276136 RepID=A0A0B4GIQ3_METGA|nr:hypothetical protein MGU_10285 [Metarhizium guizhouense ARSEF 977]
MKESGITSPPKWRDEGEFSALGGIRWDQVEAYMAMPKSISPLEIYVDFEVFAKDYPNMTWTKNEEYKSEYDRYSPSGAQPQLVGDLNGNAISSPMTLEESAIEFMSKTGAPVGWTGTFPLNLTGPVDFSNGTLKSAASSQEGQPGDQGKAQPPTPQETALSPSQLREEVEKKANEEACKSKGISETACRRVKAECIFRGNQADPKHTPEQIAQCVRDLPSEFS